MSSLVRAWAFLRRLVRDGLGCIPLGGLLLFGVLASFPVMILWPDGLGMRVANACYRLWSRWTLRGFGIRTYVIGAENLKSVGPCVVAINHRSHFDVPAMGTVLEIPVCSVHKKSLEKVPVLGQSLLLARGIGIDRNDSTDSRRRLQVVGDRLASGRYVVIFPEGTRQTGKELGDFKKGAVIMAIEQWDPLESTCRHASLSIL